MLIIQQSRFQEKEQTHFLRILQHEVRNIMKLRKLGIPEQMVDWILLPPARHQTL